MNIRGKTYSSIRIRIILIYCMLVFIATTIIGVFLTSQMENYYINSIRTNLENTAKGSGLMTSLENSAPFSEHEDEIQANIDAWVTGLSQEIFVVDGSFNIVAASNAGQGRSAVDFLDCNIILEALGGQEGESEGTIRGQSGTLSQTSAIPVFNMAFPIETEDGEIIGALYLREDTTTIAESIEQSRTLFAKAMGLALLITFVLSFVLSKSITGPINDVTEKAERMAGGDFSQEVSVKSSDEIGRLADMFNYLRKQLDDTLSEISGEKNKLETILKQMADGLVAIDLSGRIIHANQAAAAILAEAGADIENQNYDALIEDLNPELTFAKLMQKCEMEPESEIFENAGNYYDVRYDRFKDENGSDVGIIMIIQDITQRTKLENMQMDFVANVSHELKTPLTTIKSYTETLLDGALEDQETAENFLQVVDSEADRMTRLVRDLLQLSRMENKQEKWNMKEGNIISLLKSAVMKVQLTATQKNQQLNCLFSEDKRVAVVMDKDRVEQVILNILSNAINYTQEGGRIDIDMITSDKEVRIIVADNGIGIPDDEQSRVFERFFRVDKARSRSMGGTGLGLAISKQIVEEHGGRIELQSKEGQGTTFTVILPLSASASRGVPNIE
ncbi:MAG: HAMP domain-containing protein [Firmicutes bacterium]|nr:HAMP domain-containing protein [Bacillota bacterium]